MARVRWQDSIFSEEVATRCGLKMILNDKLRQKRLQWFGHYEKGNGGRSVEISGRNGSIGERKVGRLGKL